jgi:hypothetical protein
MMKKAFLSVIVIWISAAAFSFSNYEPFADASTRGGTTYEPGSAIYHQTNAQGLAWQQIGSGGTQLTISSENLTVPGLSPSSGGSLAIGGKGTSARFLLTSPIIQGTAYFSFALKLTDVSKVTETGIFFVGLNNAQREQASTPSAISSRVVVKPSGEGYQIGVDRNSGQSTNFVFDPTTFKLGDTIFIVGAYAIKPGPSNDVSRLWLNPKPQTFGATNEPEGALVSTGNGVDIVVRSLLVMNRATPVPPGSTPIGLIDEIRVGTSWAAVTPRASTTPAPAAPIASTNPVPETKSTASNPVPGPSTQTTPPTTVGPSNFDVVTWIIVAALAIIIGLLVGLFLLLRSPRRSNLALVPAAKSADSAAPSSDNWRERALSAEALAAKQSQILDEKVGPELTEFAKQALVQGLYTQRQKLLETQKQAQSALADLELRLNELQLPVQERIHAYEKRIAELEKKLETRDDEMRELTQATLLLIRQKLEQEKNYPGRFS